MRYIPWAATFGIPKTHTVDQIMTLIRQAIDDSYHMSEYHVNEVLLPEIRRAIEALR